jgi:hypothetical protein
MFQHDPAILLHAPLYAVIWPNPGGPAYFTFNKPSDQFGSFANPQITAAGVELDQMRCTALNLPAPDAAAVQCTERSFGAQPCRPGCRQDRRAIGRLLAPPVKPTPIT